MTGVGRSSRKVPTLREGPPEAEGNPSISESEAKMTWERGSVNQQSHEQVALGLGVSPSNNTRGAAKRTTSSIPVGWAWSNAQSSAKPQGKHLAPTLTVERDKVISQMLSNLHLQVWA